MSNSTAKGISDDTFAKVEFRVSELKKSGEIRFPENYSPGNALKAAWLVLQTTKDSNKRPVLEVCTKESIINSLLKMVVLGLDPQKKQCDFIAYGGMLSCDINYIGNITLAKRHGGLKSIKANAIFKDDVFEFEVDCETGKKKITKHTQKLENLGSKELRGAYAILTLEDGSVDTEIMSMPQIRQAWMQGATKGNSPAHQNFPDQMSIKTVISRACKIITRSSDDSALFYDEDETTRDPVLDRVNETISDQANKQEMEMDDDEVQQIEEAHEIPKGESPGIEISMDEDELAIEEAKMELENEPGF